MQQPSMMSGSLPAVLHQGSGTDPLPGPPPRPGMPSRATTQPQSASETPEGRPTSLVRQLPSQMPLQDQPHMAPSQNTPQAHAMQHTQLPQRQIVMTPHTAAHAHVRALVQPHQLPERLQQAPEAVKRHARDRSGLASLLDAEESLLPQQRTVYQIDLDGELWWAKLRPAAREFLDKLAAVGQITIFTMAIAHYARCVARILDPDGSLFGIRLLSAGDAVKQPGRRVKGLIKELSGSDNMALVFDDNAHVWEDWQGNLVPVPPYCYWDDEQYWRDEELNDSANVLRGFDERIAGGALMTAWEVTVSVLSNAILPPVPAGTLSSIHKVNVRLPLLEKRQQVLDGEVIHLMGFEAADVAFMRMRLEMYGAVFTESDSRSTTVIVQYDARKTPEAQRHKKAAVGPEWLLDSCAKWQFLPQEQYSLPQV